MATQTVEFRSPPSQTITGKLFAVGSDTQVASVSATEATNRKGTYSAAFTDVAAGEYELIAFVGSVPVARWFVTLTLTTATFQVYDKVTAVLDSAVRVKLDASQPDYAPATVAALAAAKTILDKIDTGLVQDGLVYQFTANMLELGPSAGGGGDATLAKQEQILAAIQGSEVIQVASPNVLGNLVLTQGDSYDGIANPKATWTVTTDYTDGWSVTLTIRDADDAVIYTTSGTVASSTSVQVAIAAPIGLTMTGTPGQWQGKFDVQLTKAGSKKTIALGVCYINEDQTR